METTKAMTATTQAVDAVAIEQVIMGGDLSALKPEQRVSYYQSVCKSLGLNPLTKPFDYIKLNGKLTLYARRDAADQLRKLNQVSISDVDIQYTDDLVIVMVNAADKTGRADSDLGAVNIKGLQGEARANAIMKAITKAKRRVTLSICGLGWLDETEIDAVPTAQTVVVDASTGEVLPPVTYKPAPEQSELHAKTTEPTQRKLGNGALEAIANGLTRRNLTEAEACKMLKVDTIEAGFALAKGSVSTFWDMLTEAQEGANG